MSCNRHNNGLLWDLRSVDKTTIRLSKFVGISRECGKWMYDTSKPCLQPFFFLFFQWSPTRNGDFTKDFSQTHDQRTCFSYVLWRKIDTCLTYRLEIGLYSQIRRWTCALHGTNQPHVGGILTWMWHLKQRQHDGLDITTNEWRFWAELSCFKLQKDIWCTGLFFPLLVSDTSQQIWITFWFAAIGVPQPLQQAWTLTFGCPNEVDGCTTMLA